MASPRRCNTGLGSDGILNASDAARAVQLYDVGRGWQTLGGVVAATTSGLTDLNDPPADAVELPDEGRNATIRYLAEQSGGQISAEIYGFPFDPGTQATTSDATKNKTDGNAAGELLTTATFTTSSKTADSPSVATADRKVSDSVVVDRQGYKYLAIRPLAATTVIPGSNLEAEYRVF